MERGRPDDVVADQHVAVEGLDLVRAVEQLPDDFFLKLVGDAAVCVINGDLQDNLRVVDGGQVEAPLPVGVGIFFRSDQHVAADKAGFGVVGVLRAAGDGLLHNREFADYAHVFGKFEVGVVESDDNLVISDGEHDGRRAGVHSALDRDVEVEGCAVADDGTVAVRRGEVVAHAGEVDDDVVRRIDAVVAVFEAGGTAAVRLAELSLCPDPAVDGRGDLAASYHILVDDADVERDAVARLGRVVGGAIVGLVAVTVEEDEVVGAADVDLARGEQYVDARRSVCGRVLRVEFDRLVVAAHGEDRLVVLRADRSG